MKQVDRKNLPKKISETVQIGGILRMKQKESSITSQPLSIDFPSINSEYKNTSHKSLAPKVKVPIEKSVARADPPQAAVALLNTHAVKSDPIENRKQPNHSVRFVGAPIVSPVKPALLTVCFTGSNLRAACKMFRIFAPKYNLEPRKTVIGIDDIFSIFVQEFRLKIRILNEQVRFNDITLAYALNGDLGSASVVFFHFDLSNAHDCQESYDISIGRIKLCRDHPKWRKKQFCMIGITDENKTSNEALGIFNKFKNDSGIDDVLVFNLDSQGEENLRGFMLHVFSKLDVILNLEESSKARDDSFRI